MNYLRLSLATGALTLALALPAFAGHIDTPVPPPPPPPATGEIDTPGTAEAAGEMHTPAAMEIALSLVQGMLSTF